MKINMQMLVCVLEYTKPCGLFNAKSPLSYIYIYIYMICKQIVYK